ncbi:cholinesterase 1-like isoform X1 [Schistocerca americana]|uniref:cholinesterase 1-like isoform X1 n=1 Tax=Schistocerca americana TaxID=7009 RepID=UPI001F4F280E|nr:cholinesterase 1-like isoform X1 [Schistocerca americana]
MFARFALSCLLAVFSVCAQDNRTTVSLSSGLQIVGLKTTTVRGVPYFSFRGIPYAVPPTGKLRYTDPIPYSSNGSVEALEDAPHCAQESGGKEDCLYLNVYTRQLDGSEGGAAVMVYLHGGALTSGSGDSTVYGPDFFLEVDGIVFVTLNYRLGAIGFLSTQDSVIRGNYGFKDQIVALRWVQQNIATFGGDPGRVTLIGESAGSASTSLHLMSPLSAGLFQRAIMQSSSALGPRGVATTARDRAFRLAASIGYRGDNGSSEELLAFLRDADVADLVRDDDRALSDEDKKRFSTFTFLAVVEEEWEGAFITDMPTGILESGHVNRVPLIAGFNSAEGLATVNAKNVFLDEETIAAFDASFVDTISLDVTAGDEQYRQEAALKIREFYFGRDPISSEDFNRLVQLISDLYYNEPVDMTVRLLVNESANVPVYEYKFSYKGENSAFPQYEGVTHADELKLLFYIPKMKQNLTETSEEDITRRKMIDLWTNFAKSGNPTPSPVDGVTWQPYGSDAQRHYLIVDTTLVAANDVYSARMDFMHSVMHPPADAPASTSAALYKRDITAFMLQFVILLCISH